MIDDVVQAENSCAYDHDRPKQATGLGFPGEDSDHTMGGGVLDVLSEFVRVSAAESFLEGPLLPSGTVIGGRLVDLP